MDDKERIELAEKLDEGLKEFISKLETRSSNEAWPEDRWQEEMEKHPFFITKIPEGGDLPPLLQGLQDLKYSPEENTPEELAKAYKEDGNFHYKLKKYCTAIICYSEGIKQQSNDVELNGQLYNNRAAAHFYLGNFRSCYNDCKNALRALPLYTKALVRLANVCLELGELDECVENCNLLLSEEPLSESTLELKKTALNKKKEKERDERRKHLLKKRKLMEKNKLLDAIKERGIHLSDKEEFDNFDGNPLGLSVSFLKNRLLWPVLLLYPEYETSDVIKSFHEDHTFMEELTEIFNSDLEWDAGHKYTIETISLYYENVDKRIVSVHMSSTLGSVLSNKDFTFDGGLATFLIFVKGSEAEKKALEQNQ